MVFTAPILATKSVAFALSNAMTGTETRKAQVAFLHSIVSLSQFHIFERFALPQLVFPIFQWTRGFAFGGGVRGSSKTGCLRFISVCC